MAIKKSRSEKILIYLFVIIGSLIMFYPFLFQVMASFGTNDDYYNSIILPIPSEFHLERYINVLKNPLVASAFINTMIRCLWLIFFTCFTSIICSFVFSKMKFRGRDFTFMVF